MSHFGANLAPNPPMYAVIGEVLAERTRQDAKFGEQNHPDGTGPDIGKAAELADGYRKLNETEEQPTWHPILLEEVYEALAESEPAKLRAELVQVAAVAVAWIEAIDRRASASATT